MPFGLCSVPATFQCCMTSIFLDMMWHIIEVFMDDFLTFWTSFKECLDHSELVLQRYKDTKLVLNLEKRHYMVQEGIVL